MRLFGRSLRNCLVNQNRFHSGVSGVGKTRREVLLSPLCATKNTRSRLVQLFSKQFLSKLSEKGSEQRPKREFGRYTEGKWAK